MNSIFDEIYIKKWKNTAIYKNMRDNIFSNLAFIDEDIIKRYGTSERILPFYISKSLFTNQDIVEILNTLHLRSATGGSYSIINEYNRSLPIKWDNDEQKYFVKSGFEMHPVTGISWNGAALIASLFNGRLPSELEWEIAATSGHKEYQYSWGNDEPNPKLANFEENVGGTSKINLYPSNELDIYDMCGNVDEWTQSQMLFNDGHISKFEMIVKGGCWYKPADNMRCTSKRTRWVKMGATGIGFRIVIDERSYHG